MAKKMMKSRLIKPYNDKGKSNLLFCKGVPGVYLIYKNSNLVYVGMSSNNVYRTLLRHFERWKSYQKVTTYFREYADNDFKVRVCLCNADKAAKLEKALIVKYQPKDNPDKLPGYRAKSIEEIVAEFENEKPLKNEEFEDVPF